MLPVYVYRHPLGDCTRNGISSRHTTLTVVNITSDASEVSGAPVMLVKHATMQHCYLVPAYQKGGVWTPCPGWWQYGGNIASTSDSRLWQAIRELLDVEYVGRGVAIHDRQE